ncbi:MAG: putative ABC transporter permease [Lachnospiraceae bacterium]|nr:putative ABC transporter permease [Lachnospiraceae bacterium]
MNTMWDVSIAGITVYHILCFMLIFSFMGWLWESFYVSVMEHRIVNRGYVTGPLCTIYGVGGVFMTLTLQPYKNNIIVMFLLAMVFTTTLEYVTATVMEALFHTSWWDYTEERFNYKGRICLKGSLAWGAVSLLLFNIILPFCERLIGLVSEKTGHIIITVIAGLYLIDFVMATIAAVDVSKQLEKMDALLDDIEEFIRSTRLYTEGEELKNRMGSLTLRLREANYLQRYSKRLEVVQAVWKEKIASVGSKYTAEAQSRLKELMSRVTLAKSWNSLLQGRILRAYPKIMSSNHFRKKQEENIKKL